VVAESVWKIREDGGRKEENVGGKGTDENEEQEEETSEEAEPHEVLCWNLMIKKIKINWTQWATNKRNNDLYWLRINPKIQWNRNLKITNQKCDCIEVECVPFRTNQRRKRHYDEQDEYTGETRGLILRREKEQDRIRD
jgi:hypothetical protein